MKANGTDRDIALQILSELEAIATAFSQINEKKYVPHIETQPTDFVGAVDDRATFTVVANNVSGYQWQMKLKNATQWSDSTVPSATASTLSVAIIEALYNYEFRCKITGKDNSVIYTNVVTVYPSEAQG